MKENHRRCCGIDVHKNSVTVCVLASIGQRHREVKKRKFRTYTRDLKQLRSWLKNCQVTELLCQRDSADIRSAFGYLVLALSRLLFDDLASLSVFASLR